MQRCPDPAHDPREPEDSPASTLTDKKPIQFHVKCFYVWDAERRA